MNIRSKACVAQLLNDVQMLRVSALLCMAFVVSCMIPTAQSQTIPSATVFQSTMLVNINGNAGQLAANSVGDAFYVSQTDNTAYWLKRGTTTPIALVTGLSGGRNVAVDKYNNVYVPSNYSGVVIEIPYVNGTYATGSARTSLSACTAPAHASSTSSPAGPAAPCTQFGNGGSGVSYYYQDADLTFDAAGNAYFVDPYNNENSAGTGKNNAIEVFRYNGVSYAGAVIVQGLPETQNGVIAADPSGDLWYVDGTSVYFISATQIGAALTALAAGNTPPAVSATPVSNSALTNPTGVAVDQFGNVYVSNASTPYAIIEFPQKGGVGQPGSAFTFDPVYTANGVGLDNLGDMYYTGYSTQTNLNVAHINGIPLGSAAVGTPVAVTPTQMTVVFNAAETLVAPVLSGATSGFTYTAGSCAAIAYTAGQSCTINANYTPTAVGLQKGAVTLTNSSAAVVVAAELSGVGLGAAQTSDPGTTSSIGSGYTAPQGIAVDGAKNVYVANTGKNTVVEYLAGSSTAISLGSGLAGPTSVALDNAGNLYIADSGNGRVLEVPIVAGVLATSAQTVIASGLGTSLGLATDPYGNLYIADSKNNKVTQLQMLSGAPSTSASSTVTLPSSSVAPFALATDSVGNLFVADVSANTITEVSYYGKALTNIGSGYSHPSGLAVDASGSLFVADPGNVRLIKIPFESPIYNSNDQYSVGPPFTVASGVNIPYAVAVDSSSNLYVLDSTDATVTLLNRQQGTLNLGNSNIGSTTAQESAYIADAGNQSLLLGNPDYVATSPSNTAAFTITSPSGNGCTNSETILAGYSCVLQATFKPTTTGTVTETLNFNDNAANTSTPSLTLSGTGSTVAATTLSLVQTAPAGTAAFGQTVTIAATISSGTSGTPSGDIIFYVDGNFYTVVKVTGATQSINITGLLGGSHTIAASYTGDNTFASSNSTLTLVVAKANSTVTVSASGVFAYPTSAPAGASVILTAVIVPSATTAPTKTVTFTVGNVTLGTASVVTVNGTYQASLTTTALPLGNDTVVATYSGDVNYAVATGTIVILISPQTFSVTPATQTVTVAEAGTVAIPLQAESISGFGNAFVSLTCSGLPANTNCGFNPNGFALQPGNLITAQVTNLAGTIVLVPATYGPTNLVLNVTTGTTPVVTPPTIMAGLHIPGIPGRMPLSLASLLLAPFTLLLTRRSRRLRRSLRLTMRLTSLLLVFVFCMTAFSGCGSNLVGNTPAGTYQVTVTATASDPSYPAVTTSTPLAAGCSFTPSTATFPTCIQKVQFTLVVQ